MNSRLAYCMEGEYYSKLCFTAIAVQKNTRDVKFIENQEDK